MNPACAPQHRGAGGVAARPSKRSTGFSWSDSGPLISGGQETGLAHTQWLEQPTLHELIERLAAGACHDLRKDDEVDITVDDPRARWVDQVLINRKGEGGRRALKLLLERKVRPQA